MKRLFFLALSLILAVTLALPMAMPVSADPNTISGTVRDLSGNPIAGAVVKFYASVVGTRPLLWSPTYTSSPTDSTGSYNISGIPSGDYVVTACADGYQRIFYPSATTITASTSISITTDGEYDFKLGPGGKISGTITLGGQPLAGMSVSVTMQNGGVRIVLRKQITTGNMYWMAYRTPTTTSSHHNGADM